MKSRQQPKAGNEHPTMAGAHFQWMLTVPKFALLFAVRAYRLTISPAQVLLFGAASGCRFTPTCSAYALDAVREHGAVTGTVLAAKRICRCHPWGGCGHDPVPKAAGGWRPGNGKITAAATY